MSHKLSLRSAIFINLNIMAGAGLFINTVILTKFMGILGSFTYMLVGIFMLPLIASVAQLVKLHPSGGFYSYARPLSPFWGFVSCWSYFFGKLASASLILYVSAIFLQQLLPSSIAQFGALPLSIVILAIFTYLNLFNLKVGSFIQNIFFIAKSIPILFVIAVGISFISNNSLSVQSLIENSFATDLTNIWTIIPLALYSLGGFEAACSISRKIENPHINAPKAIFYSFFTIIVVYTAFQFLTSVLILPQIEQISSYQNVFPYITTVINVPNWLQQSLSSFVCLLISLSALGGAYGMLFSNPWNLYTLAEHNHTFMPDKIMKLNDQHIPTFAIIIESIICIVFLLITQGNQIPLQQTTSFGSAIAYTISIIALLHQSNDSKVMPLLALVPCLGFIALCLMSLWNHNIASLSLFMIMLITGITMFWVQKTRP